MLQFYFDFVFFAVNNLHIVALESWLKIFFSRRFWKYAPKETRPSPVLLAQFIANVIIILGKNHFSACMKYHICFIELSNIYKGVLIHLFK